MEIKIITVEENRIPESIKPVLVVPESTSVTLEKIFTEFLQLEVGDGAASADTIRNYLSQTKQYLDWSKDNLLLPLDAEVEDIKLYRQYLVQSGYQNNTIATKLNIVRIFYKAALTHGLIKSNPAEKIKAPKDRKDPAARITFMEAEELKFLLDHIQFQLDEAKTNKQRLVLMRDRILIGIMSLEGCRTVEMHQLKIEDIVRQGIKTGLQVSAKRASRVVPLTDNLATQLDEYLKVRQKVLRRKIKPIDFAFVSLSNNSKGKQLTRRSIRAIIDGYLVATNLKYTPGRTLSAHSLRHTAGTLALRTGSDLRQVQDLLGHADPRTTSIYAHVGDRWEHNPGASIEEKLNL
ncbi:tyrosine-type recombinase/integrase [Waterburya agarophytonicola K14]|uniref:Tyrosine-type recombinase/integrase n=1 Tax=Waterburya agarophytonicola KI4 TaxID=2874699 RepID=A0A964FLD5_9CYAN|nr:tyrosine-type recombinase/integrase [Waterburya agarophytonicola]MCC0179729.1 tyrosine-type recombinase/integrase [Waterburya agarophytonicola KI4]